MLASLLNLAITEIHESYISDSWEPIFYESEDFCFDLVEDDVAIGLNMPVRFVH